MTKEESTKEKVGKSKEEAQKEVEQQLNEIRSDILDIKKSWISHSGDAPSKTKYVFSKHLNKILIIGVVSLFAAYIIANQYGYSLPNPPQWLYIVIIATILGAIVSYPIANWLVDKFITDDRTPIVEVDPTNINDVGVYKVPTSKVPDIKMLDGEKQEIETSEGKGYVVQQLGLKNIKGETKLVAVGTWIGALSGYDIYKREKAYVHMHRNLRPLVERAIEYDIKMPTLQQEITAKVANDFIEEFEEITMPSDGSTYNDLEETMNEDSIDLSTIDLEMDEKDMNGNGEGEAETVSEGLEAILNGESNE
jgi:hypothetical protein